MSLKITSTQKIPGYHVLALEGRLDTETHAQLQAALDKLPVASVRGVRLDLAKLSYISSMGLRVVMKLMKDLKAHNAIFQTVHVQPQIKKVFDIAAALPPETVFKSVEEADAYLDLMQKKVLRGDSE